MLEKENPGCFDDPDNTFADLYMKSGMYITEIVTRLYQSKRIKALYPDNTERLNHIFAKQVYGCAPTEIIYRICLRYILGFSDEIHIEKNNIKLCDTLEYVKNWKKCLICPMVTLQHLVKNKEQRKIRLRGIPGALKITKRNKTT